MAKPALPSMFWAFARYGNLTFGGGSATGQHSFDLAYALSRLTPGTNLLAFCVAIGWMLRSWRGALIAALAGSVPCSAIAVLLTVGFDQWSKDPTAQIALKGALVAAVAVMAVTGLTIVRPHWRSASWLQLLLFVAGSFVASAWLGIPPIRVLLIAALIGTFWPAKGRKP